MQKEATTVKPDFKREVVVLGRHGVGKSTLFDALVKDNPQVMSVIQLHSAEADRAAFLKLDFDGRSALVCLKDLSPGTLKNFMCEGREMFNPLKAEAFVLVYSLTETVENTVHSLNEWHAMALRYCECEHPTFTLIGCKVNVAEKGANHERTLDKMDAWARAHEMPHTILGSFEEDHGSRDASKGRTALEEVCVASLMDHLMDYPILRRGFIIKQGGFIRNWKRRLFVLNRSGLLLYYTDASMKDRRGVIALSKALDVVTFDHCNAKWPVDSEPDCCFGIVTEKRTYFLIAETAEEAVRWREDIALVMDMSTGRPEGGRSHGANLTPSLANESIHSMMSARSMMSTALYDEEGLPVGDSRRGGEQRDVGALPRPPRHAAMRSVSMSSAERPALIGGRMRLLRDAKRLSTSPLSQGTPVQQPRRPSSSSLGRVQSSTPCAISEQDTVTAGDDDASSSSIRERFSAEMESSFSAPDDGVGNTEHTHSPGNQDDGTSLLKEGNEQKATVDCGANTVVVEEDAATCEKESLGEVGRLQDLQPERTTPSLPADRSQHMGMSINGEEAE